MVRHYNGQINIECTLMTILKSDDESRTMLSEPSLFCFFVCAVERKSSVCMWKDLAIVCHKFLCLEPIGNVDTPFFFHFFTSFSFVRWSTTKVMRADSHLMFSARLDLSKQNANAVCVEWARNRRCDR